MKTVHVGSVYNPCCHVCDKINRNEIMSMGLSYLSLPVRMILCPICGNKRCPKAEYHAYKCTGSNDVGQVGELSDEKIDI